jgi:hypothetical protein
MEKGTRKDAPTLDEVPRIVGASPCGCPGTMNALGTLRRQARHVPGKGCYQADVWRTRQLHQ